VSIRKRLFFSAALALLTSVGVGIAEAYLPYSETKTLVIDAASLPGAMMAGLLYPEGIHTGRGAPAFAYLALVANFLVYVLVWYGALTVVHLVQELRRAPM
jgi:hypothetical protein